MFSGVSRVNAASTGSSHSSLMSKCDRVLKKEQEFDLLRHAYLLISTLHFGFPLYLFHMTDDISTEGARSLWRS